MDERNGKQIGRHKSYLLCKKRKKKKCTKCISGGSRMISDQTTVLTLCIRKDSPEQTVCPDHTPQNAASDQGLHCLPLIQQF